MTGFLVLACVLGALSFVAVSVGGLLYVALRPRGNASFQLSRSFHWIMVTLLGWRVTVENRGRLAESAPAVLMATHKSNLDIVVYGELFPRRAVVIGKKEIEKIPVFGWFFRAAGNILLDRRDLALSLIHISEPTRPY